MRITSLVVKVVEPINLILKAKMKDKKYDPILPFYEKINKDFSSKLTDTWQSYNEELELEGFKYRVSFRAKK